MDMSGIDAVIALRTQFPDARTIVLTTFGSGAEVKTALAGGARSYRVGKRGIRIGERVQVSGITGDVINMGLLQFQLKEFDVQKQRSTGHVPTFSNSLVFVSPATGLVKLNSVAEKAADA